MFHYAAMAQLVERVLGKDEVGGSNPPSSSKEHPQKVFFSFYLQTADRGRADARWLAIPSFAFYLNTPALQMAKNYYQKGNALYSWIIQAYNRLNIPLRK